MDHWYTFAELMLQRTGKFPRSVRFTISSRIDNLLLDGIELLVEARYCSDAAPALRRMNILLEKLRFFCRLSFRQGHLSSGAYREASEMVEEAGRMVGGWIRADSGETGTAG